MDKQADNNAGPTRVRPGVWLAVMGLALIVVVAFWLLPHRATSVPDRATDPFSNTPVGDSARAARVKPTGRPLTLASEPMEKTLAGWVSDLESTNAEVVQAARQALADLGPDAAPAFPQLARMLSEGGTCNSAAWALVKIGTNALPVLIDALTNGNRFARLEVAGGIGYLREAAEAAVPGLVECITYGDAGVRGNAIASLQAIPKRPDIAVPALLAALADPDTSVRDNAATVLRKYGQVQAEATIPMLVQVATQDENPLVKFRAAEILRAVAPERARAEGL